MIRGVGPAYAKKLLRAFGEKVFDIIEATPYRLREVDGIGPVRASRITEAWAELRKVAWPTRQTVINLTLIVVAVSIAVGAYIAVLDVGFAGLLDQVL